MPPRKTITFSSDEVAGGGGPDDQLYVYYCKYSGKHAMTTDCDINKLPKRSTDGAAVLDTSKYLVRMYATEGGAKYIKRTEGGEKAERQFRLYIGPLPVAYRTEPDGKMLYIMRDALSSFNDESQQLEAMVPPCIIPAGDGSVQVMIDFEDRQKMTKIIKVTADGVRMSLRTTLDGIKAKDEVFEFFGKVLQRQFKHFALLMGLKGFSSRILLVEGLAPEQVYKRLYNAVQKGFIIKDKKVEQNAVVTV